MGDQHSVGTRLTEGWDCPSGSIDLSVVIPVFNEEENLPELYGRLTKALDAVGASYELIFVDDGCVDGSLERLRQISACDPRVRAVRFARNFGQHVALSAGIERSQGEIVVLMDADLQSDPEDIPRFIAKIREGCDMVAGWRANRSELGLVRRVGSALMNMILNLATGVCLHDHGCGFRAMTRRVAQWVNRSGDLRRFLALLLVTSARAVGEVPIANHPRRRGRSKYSLFKLFALTFELLIALSGRSFRLVGWGGILATLVGCVAALGYLLGRFVLGMGPNYLLLMTIVLLICGGLQGSILGLLGEYVIRGYHTAQGVPFYLVEEEIGGKGTTVRSP